MNGRDHQPGAIRRLNSIGDRRPEPVHIRIRGPRDRIILTRKPSHGLAAVRLSYAAHCSCSNVANKPKGQHLKLPARNNQVQR